jgi:PAS domain S-box-containing protein
MQHPRSSIPETSARTEDGRDERSRVTETPDERERRELPLRGVMDTIPGLVWSALPSGDVEFCNQRWLDYTGMPFHEIKGWGWAAAIHPQDVTDLREGWRTGLAGSTSFEAEARMRRADGCYRWFLIQAVPLRDSGGRIVRWYGMNTDIEDLKLTQQELQKQTSRLDQLFEQAPEAVAVLSTDDRIVRVNKEFTRMFGYEAEEVLQRPINGLIVPEAEMESSQAYTRVLQQGGRVEVETVRKRKDGTEIDVSLLAISVRTPSGEQVVNYAIYRDITERRHAQERLRESEVRFQAMADTAPVLIWMTGTDGLCNYFNKPWLDFTGRTMEQEVGTGWTEGVHPDDVQGCFDVFLPAFHAREPFTMEYRLKRADGEYRWVIESGIPRYTGGGEFAGYIGSNIDITDRKRAESLLAGEKRILEMLAKGDSLVEILNSLCRLVEEQASGVLTSILLLDGDRLRHGGACSLPKAYTDAVEGAVIGPSAGSCGTAAYRGEQVIVEDIATDPLWADYRDLALPHSLRACWSTPVLSSQRKVIATFAMYYREPKRPSTRDSEVIEQITSLAGVAIERKLAQEALRRSNAYLDEAQRLTQTGSWAWNPLTGKGIYWSEEMFRIFGFDPREGAPGPERFWTRLHPEDRESVIESFEKAVREKADFVNDHRIVLPDGAVKHVHVIGHPIFGERQVVAEYVGTAVDITERKQVEEERERLHQLEADLARINRVSMMGELAASLAHEIKQPIAAALTDAKTCVRWLRRDAPDVTEGCEAALRVINDATRAAEVIDRVRSLYLRDTSDRELLDINEIIQEMTALLHDRANRTSISIRTELDSGLPLITADRVQLQQVLMNLILNGIEAMKDAKGELTIASKRAADGQLLVSVSDSGIGLPAGKVDRIFEAFFTTKEQGTGIGLSISRRIIESHGGSLSACANAQRGATFQFTLPTDVAASSPSAA